MFDNLRDDSSSSVFDKDASELFPVEEVENIPTTYSTNSPSNKNGKLLGMTAMQRFIIVLMLMIAVSTLGAMCLLLTGKIGLV